MSLLTKEQQDTLEFMRQHIVNRRGMVNYFDVEKALHNAVSIIDDLQSRAPKQYTEQELMAVFESMPIADLFPPIREEQIIGKVAWRSWKVCARFLGALKAEP